MLIMVMAGVLISIVYVIDNGISPQNPVRILLICLALFSLEEDISLRNVNWLFVRDAREVYSDDNGVAHPCLVPSKANDRIVHLSKTFDWLS